MQAQSRTLLFGVSTAVAVSAIAFISWRIADQNPRLLTRGDGPRVVAPAQNADETPPVSDTSLTLKAATALDAAGGGALEDLPVFDLVRVEPSGEAVVAGRAQPGASVRLLDRGVAIAEVRADDNGQFAIVPPPLPKGDHLLSLEVAGMPASAKAQTVAVAVPPDSRGEVVVALTEPGAATRILSDRAPAAPAISGALAIRSVEVDEAGGFYATGTGAPGSTIRLSLNGSPVTTVKANDDGRWSLKVERGMNAGAYAVRADHLDDAGRVLAQAEVPFDYPARSAALAQPTGGGAQPAGSGSGSDADAVVAEVQSVTVQRGDSLWRISQRMLGHGLRYTQIYQANSNQIRKPSLIYPNQILVVPQGGKAAN